MTQEPMTTPVATPDPEAEPPEAAVPGGAAARRRPPPSRLSPEALARSRADGGAEGLAWLGREPEARASILYRLLRLVARFVIFGLFRFRISTSGRELLPASGGYLLIGGRASRLDGPVRRDARAADAAAVLVPRAARPSTFTSRWRERLIHRLGGLLPVWRGGVGVDSHVAAARAVIGNGAVFVQMPEGTVSGPAGRIGPFRNGAALIALRTGAPIVPLAIAGTEELYIGRRMASRILPPTTARELLGGEWDGSLPAAGSREELELAARLTERLEAVMGPVVEALHPATIDPPAHPRHLQRRLTWLLLRPGRLDRDPAA